MKTLKKLKKIMLVLSILLCGYAQMIMIDRMLTGNLPNYHLPIMAGIYTWLSLMYYANCLHKK